MKKNHKLRTKVRQLLVNNYRLLFGRRIFSTFNKLIFDCSLRGLGVLNFENEKVSGEDLFLKNLSNMVTNLIAFDIGANVGRYSNRLKELCPNATIYAFEPHPKTFSKLQGEASKKGYSALNIGFSNIQEKVTLYDYQEGLDGSEHASVYEDVFKNIHKSSSISSCEVQLTTIDSFFEKNNLSRIHLLKVDTEGNDFKVLLGAKQVLSKGSIDIIHFEFNEMNVISRTFLRDFYELLPDYKFYRMLRDGIVPLGSYSPLLCEIFGFQNIVAIRKESKIDM